MKITIIGGGYVGLVTAAGLATLGHHVNCIENNSSKLNKLRNGQIPIYEPGLEELIVTAVRDNRLVFSDDLNCVDKSDIIFLAVGTPSRDDGSADLTAYNAVLELLVPIFKRSAKHILVTKSTVPIGTANNVRAYFEEALKDRISTVSVVSNPEFLREGNAVADFMKPDRVVIGAFDRDTAQKVRALYEPLENVSQFICTDPCTAEFIKYASNSMLATRVSFMNEMALLAEETGADIDMIRRGVGSDSRIGSQYLYPGPGFGGSCFGKDLMALAYTAKELNSPCLMLEATLRANDNQKYVLVKKVRQILKIDQTVCIWGLAFKARTDDVRDSPALTLIDNLLTCGVKIHVHDPKAMPNIRSIYGDKLSYYDNMYDAASGAGVLVVITEWRDYLAPDFDRLKSISPNMILVDGRNIWRAHEALDAGFSYTRIGKRMVIPEDKCR